MTILASHFDKKAAFEDFAANWQKSSKTAFEKIDDIINGALFRRIGTEASKKG